MPSMDELTVLEELLIQRQLQLWQLTEVDYAILQRITELKTKIKCEDEVDYTQIISNDLVNDGSNIQTAKLDFIGRTESEITVQNMKVQEFIDNQIERCCEIDDMKMLLKKYCKSGECNNTEYSSVFIDDIDVKNTIIDINIAESQLMHGDTEIQPSMDARVAPKAAIRTPKCVICLNSFNTRD